ncbi:flagellar motor protein MotB [Opitutaceae bacterium EW11]|nr:flagellar motor protein MotB [Opitutaceae bacterium EW11]
MARKKAAAHHGGAWKVAYADFVTAMMALFMVLWISAQDQKILIATSRYFQNPFNSLMDKSPGILPYDTNEPSKPHGDDSGTNRQQPNSREIDLQFLNSLAKDFFRLLHVDEDLADKPIDIQVTSDGLRITLYDRARRPLFGENNAEFTEWGRFVMQSLAWLIDRHQFRVVIEGHTRKGLVLPDANYGAWELSTDRANAARRALTHYAVDNSLIERVTGFADTRPVPFQPADSEGNQRVTLSLTMRRVRPADKPAAGNTVPKPSESGLPPQTTSPATPTAAVTTHP